MFKLSLVHPRESAGATQVSASVDFKLSDMETLEATFEVHGDPFNCNEALPKDSSQWGLWDWDVVELFVTVEPPEGHATPSKATPKYYEFQVSPIGQFFELEIFEPRKKFNKSFSSGFKYNVFQLETNKLQVKMSIPLKQLGWRGNPADIRGNAFAVLGKPESRTYWSVFLPQQERPDFHLPEFFKPLL